MFFFHDDNLATHNYFAVADCIATLMKGGIKWSNRFHHFPDCAGTRCNTLSHGKTTRQSVINQTQAPIFKLPEIEIIFAFQGFLCNRK